MRQIDILREAQRKKGCSYCSNILSTPEIDNMTIYYGCSKCQAKFSSPYIGDVNIGVAMTREQLIELLAESDKISIFFVQAILLKD